MKRLKLWGFPYHVWVDSVWRLWLLPTVHILIVDCKLAVSVNVIGYLPLYVSLNCAGCILLFTQQNRLQPLCNLELDKQMKMASGRGPKLEG